MIREEVDELRVTIEEGPESYNSIFIDMRRIWQEITNIYQEINYIGSLIIGAGRGHAFGIHGVPVTIPHNTETTIPIDTAVSNPDGWLDTDSGIFTVPVDGIYFVSTSLALVFDDLHNVHAWTLINNSKLISNPTVTRPVAAPGDFEVSQIQGMLNLAAEQTVTLQGFHLGGGGNTMETGATLGSHAGIWLIERI